MENLGGHIAQRLVPPPGIRPRQQKLKNPVKTDSKLFFPCPVSLDFSILFQISWPGLSKQANFWS